MTPVASCSTRTNKRRSRFLFCQCTAATPGFLELCGALAWFPSVTLCVVTPQDFGTEGFCGSMMLSEIEAHAVDAIAEDGSVVLSPDLLNHMENEYGMEARTDPDAAARIEQAVRYFAVEAKKLPSYASCDEAIQGLRARAKRLAGPAGVALASIARLMAVLREFHAQHEKPTINAVYEDAPAAGLHCVIGDLSGFEPGMADDLGEWFAQSGADGAITITHADPDYALRLACFEAAAMSVLSACLERFGEAS